jgi:hypothetical protein
MNYFKKKIKRSKNMKKSILKILFVTILIFGVYITICNNVIAYSEPTINVDPVEPEQLSKITFSITFDDYDDIQDVFLLYNECTKNNICFTRENKSLIDLGSGKFKLDVNLETDDGWKAFPEEPPYPKTYLKEIQTNNEQNNNDTPGFELIGIIFSIIFILLFIHIRKR